MLILVAAVGLVAAYMWHASREVFHRQWVRELETQAKLAAALLPLESGAVEIGQVSNYFSRLALSTEHRFTLVLSDGRVIGDSLADASHMDLHGDRVEIREAVEKGSGMSERYSVTLGKTMLYLAHRVPPEGPAQAVVRVAVPTHTLMREMSLATRSLLVLIAAVLAATLVLSYGASLRIVGPVSDLRNGLARIGDGELSYRLPIPAVPHLADLARSINQTAEGLQAKIHALNEERNLRASILASMTRGVIAVDASRRIMDVNAAARRMLGLGKEAEEGARIGELTRYPELLSLIDESECCGGMIEREAVLDGEGELVVNMRATPLNDVSGARIGTLLVLGDVTRLRHLETVRQDFVANVSHELRTPVTSIKGFAETLLDGAMSDPATAERFLKIIVRQAGQLESIICDLLELSRLEQSSTKTLERQPTPLAGVLKSAAELCQLRAAERGYVVSAVCEEGLTANVHAGLVEQAIVNLIDNAIKYGANPARPAIGVQARREGGAVRIAVRDEGNGIERKHLDRLFERFYRVDKGRSREQGGTGLGLAIVKHIVLIHGGTVSVESELGRGTIFTICLPS
jgi:two-component system phosphate regulon sensor histidine kinase PhoR